MKCLVLMLLLPVMSWNQNYSNLKSQWPKMVCYSPSLERGAQQLAVAKQKNTVLA